MSTLEQHFATSNDHMQLEALGAHLPDLQEEADCAGRLAILAREDAALASTEADKAHTESAAAADILKSLTAEVRHVTPSSLVRPQLRT